MTSNRKTLLSRVIWDKLQASTLKDMLSSLQTAQHAQKSLEGAMGLWAFPKAGLGSWIPAPQLGTEWAGPWHSRALLPPKPCLSCCSTRAACSDCFQKGRLEFRPAGIFLEYEWVDKARGGGRRWEASTCCWATAQPLRAELGPGFVNTHSDSRNTESSILAETAIQNNHSAFQGNVQNTQKSSGTPLIAGYSLCKG